MNATQLAEPHGAPGTMGIRVAVLDDHPAMRAGLEAILGSAPDLRFVGAAATERDLHPLLSEEQPNVLVIDLHYADRDLLALCSRVKLRPDAPAVVMYHAASDPEVAVAAVIAGADAVLSQAAPTATLLDAIRASALQPARPPTISSRLTARAAARLDPRDHAIFAMRLAGNSPTEIADTLRLPSATVKRRIAQIAERLAGPASTPPHTSDAHHGARPRSSTLHPLRRRGT